MRRVLPPRATAIEQTQPIHDHDTSNCESPTLHTRANAGLRAVPPETKQARSPVSRDCNLHVGPPFIVEQDAGHPNPSAFLRSHLFGFVPRDGSQPTRRCEIVADAAVQHHQRCWQTVQRPCASKFGALCSIVFRVCFQIHVLNPLRAVCVCARVLCDCDACSH